MHKLGDARPPIGFSEARHARVRVDAHEDPGEISRDDGGADIGDFHLRSLSHGVFSAYPGEARVNE